LQHDSNLIAKVYVLAEKLIDFDTKKLVIHAVLTRHLEGDFPIFSSIAIIYAATTETDPMRRLCVDIYLHSKRGSYVAMSESRLPQEFLRDLALGCLKWKENLPLSWQRHKFDPADYTNEKEEKKEDGLQSATDSD
jgi:hypothetical protein